MTPRRFPNLVVSGAMRSGKDSVAGYLRKKYGYEQLTFAFQLKEEVARGVGCHISDLDDEPLRTFIRPVLQTWGTEFRRGMDPEYWTRQMGKRLDKLPRGIRGELYAGGSPIIITDGRFPNELEMLTGYGFITICLDMSEGDVWAYLKEQGKSKEQITEMLAHESENAWRGYKFDYIVPSKRGELEALFADVEEVIQRETQS